MFVVQVIFNGNWYDLERFQTKAEAEQIMKDWCTQNHCNPQAFRVL